MIGEQYKKGQDQVWKGAKMALGRGQKRVFKGEKRESRQIRESGKGKNGPAASLQIFPAVFSPFRLFFHPFFMILDKNE